MKIAKIETTGMVDGPGIRTVIFTSGCPLRCLYCHNPEMWSPNDIDADYEVEDIIITLKKYQTYYDESGGGVTFSGGEPLLQEELPNILKACKKNNIHTALDTCGHFYDQKLAEEITKLSDLIILDIKHTDSNEYLKLTSQPINQLFEYIDILNKHHKEVWIRTVIMPNYNDNEAFIYSLLEFIKPINNVTNIELLPFHNLANDKYKELKINNPLKDTPAMNINKLKKLEPIIFDN